MSKVARCSWIESNSSKEERCAAGCKRVGVVYLLTHAGGVQSCALALIRGLNERGIVPDVLWDQAPSPKLMEAANAKAGFVRLPFRIATGVIQQLPETLRYLAWTANVVDGELFHGQYDYFFLFYNGFLVPQDVPHVYYLSGPPLLPQLECSPAGLRGVPIHVFRVLYRTVLRRFWPAYEYHPDCRYVINSHYTAGLFRSAHGVNLPIVHPAIDLSGRAFSPSDLPRRDSLLFFSRIVDYKRPEMVLELARRHPHFRCVIMGGSTPNQRSYLDRLKRQAKERSVPAVFLTNPDHAAVLAELSRARFYIFPAVDEHFGMTTPEAIASGAIPFVHDSGGQREIVPDERLRFSDEEFYSKFEGLASLSEISLNGIRVALSGWVKQFSSETFVTKMLHISGLESN